MRIRARFLGLPQPGVISRWLPALVVAATTGACMSGLAPTTFDLSAPHGGRGGGGPGQIVVSEPTAVQPVEGERIIVKDAAGAVSFVGGGQWADRLPRLVQARLIQTFENSSRLRAVSRPGDRVAADYLLNTEIRVFQILAPSGEAVVEISARLVNDRSGRIVGGRVFSARAPIAALDAANAAQALDSALSSVLLDIVRWAGAARQSQST
jgi:cholesterol transport system auxiliary component